MGQVLHGSAMTTIRPEVMDELLTGYERPGNLLGEEGLFRHLKKALLERALGAEPSMHLGYEKGDPAGRGTGNGRNGYSDKTVLSEDGEIDIAVPRDRTGSFEPRIVPKGERRLDGFDVRIVSLYARGMTVREIRGHLDELYGVAVSPDLISRVTDAVHDEVRESQNRPLDPVYTGDFRWKAVTLEGEMAHQVGIMPVAPPCHPSLCDNAPTALTPR